MTVKERRVEVRCEDAAPLLYVLRNDLSLNGPKFSCGLGLMVTLVVAVGEAQIEILDGLAVGGKARARPIR